VLLGDGARFVCQHLRRDVVGGPIGQAAGQIGPLAHGHSPLRGPGQRGDIGAGRDQDQLVQYGRRGLDSLAVDRGRVELAFHDAPGQQLRHDHGPALEGIRQVAQPDRQAPCLLAGQPPLDRRPQASHRLAIQPVFRAGRDGQQATRPRFARGRQGCGESVRSELAELGQGPELAARPAIELAQDPVEGRLADNRKGQDVRSHVPRLIGDDAQLHSREPSGLQHPPTRAADSIAPATLRRGTLAPV
jgi:hypothetical protein